MFQEMVPDHPDRPAEQIRIEEEVESSQEWLEMLTEVHGIHHRILQSLRKQGLIGDVQLEMDDTREVLQCLLEHHIPIDGVTEEETAMLMAINMRQWLTKFGYPGVGKHAVGPLIGSLMEHSRGLAMRADVPPIRLFS